MDFLVATLRISCLELPSLQRDPGMAATSAPLSGVGAAPSDERGTSKELAVHFK